jgi:putative pyruvate formate lyase activating enzyme
LGIGNEVSFEELAEMMTDLQNYGCHNINFVTPTPQVPQIVKSLLVAIDRGLKIPLVYNTGTYDSMRVLKLLDGIFDIYMPDAKYSDDKIALKYSNAPDYFETMKKAIKEMHRQVGDLILDEKVVATRGLIVRHLVLPNNLVGSEEIFKFLSEEISKDTFLNIMNQYYPSYKAFELPEISDRVSRAEYRRVVNLAKKAGLKRIYGQSE